LKNGTIVVEIVIFVYDANSRMVAEYSTNPTPQSQAQTSYMTNDTLGSPRIITNQNGQVTSRRDFMPYGEDLYTAERSNQLGYKNDNVKERFTGYARDQESGLEYAQARMYSASLGRFTGCDPVYVSKEHTVNPQRWNLYVYVVNNPLVLTDPDGRKPKPKIIDVYIIFNKDERSPKNDEAWKNLKKTAKNADIRVHYVAEENAGEKIMKSLSTKGRSVIIMTHSITEGGITIGKKFLSDNPRTGNTDKRVQTIQGTGLTTFDAQFAKNNDGTDRFVDIERDRNGGMIFEMKQLSEIKAKNLYVFSCNPGKSFGQLLSGSLGVDNRAAYYNQPNPLINAGLTRISSLLNAGLATATSIANGDSTATTVATANAILSNDPNKNDAHLQNVLELEALEVKVEHSSPNVINYGKPKP
jgi:RHS repeat-associated protein